MKQTPANRWVCARVLEALDGMGEDVIGSGF
jgi:hypothetical protein